MTEFNPTSGRPEAPGGGRLSRIALLALVAGSALILLNVLVLGYVVNKERVFAERENEISADDLKVKQGRGLLDTDLLAKSGLENQIAALHAQIGQKQAELDALKSKAADQQTINAKLDAMRAELQSDQDASKKALTDKAASEADRDAAKSEVARFNEQREAARADLASLADRQTRTSASIDQLNQKKTSLEQDAKTTETKLAAAQANLTSTAARLENLQADAQKANADTKAAQAGAAAALVDQQTAEKRRDAANQDAVHADDLRKQTDDLVKAAEQRRKTAEDELAKLGQQEQTLKASISTLTQQQAQAVGGFSAAQDQLKELTTKRDGLQQNLITLKGQLDLAQSQIAATAALKAQFDAAQTALAQKQSDLARATSSFADAQKQLDEKQKQISDKVAAVGALDMQTAELGRQIEKLRAERDQLIRDTAGKDALDKLQHELNAQIGDASTRLEQTNRALTSARAGLALIDVKAGQLDQLEASIAEMSRKKEALSDEVTKLEARAASLRQSINWLLAPLPAPLQFPGAQLNGPVQPTP